LERGGRARLRPVERAVRHESRYSEFGMATCGQCGAELDGSSRGRPSRFCGNACRCAAYRRRQRGLPEAFARQPGPLGRRRLEAVASGDDELQPHQETTQQVEGLLAQVFRSLSRR